MGKVHIVQLSLSCQHLLIQSLNSLFLEDMSIPEHIYFPEVINVHTLEKAIPSFDNQLVQKLSTDNSSDKEYSQFRILFLPKDCTYLGDKALEVLNLKGSIDLSDILNKQFDLFMIDKTHQDKELVNSLSFN
jgi:hypothetical protein